jgi:hypothetical protein
MKLLSAVTHYITYRQTLGDIFNTNGHILKSFARAVGLRRRLVDVQPEQVSRFLYGTGPITANWHAKLFRPSDTNPLLGFAIPPNRTP